ncbi:hypothetical protein Q1695_014959 [Nippostrongylus brasiliensis]|nr:hypothetical protein Q1695_014959 [Nippostrongylus brasiliensis]
MKLDQSLAVDVSCPSITRLRYNASKAELSAWKDVANTLGFTLERILQLRSESFWSTVVYRSEVMKAVDEIVEALPRRFEHDEYRLVFGWDPSIRETASRLYYSTFALFLRLAVFNKKADPTMSEKEFVEVVRGRSILSTRRFATLCSLFSEHWQIVSEVVKTYSAMDKRFWLEMGQLLNELGQALLEVENDRVTSEFYKRYGAAKTKAALMIDEWLCSALALSQEGMVFVDILSQCNEALKEKADCVARVPAFVEFVDNTFTTEFIFDVAALISDYPLRRLSRLRAQLCQSAVAMYRNVLVRMNQDTRTCMVQSILENQRFIYLLNEVENLSELLKNCEKTSRDYVERAVESACVEETRKAVVELEKCGLLKGIGDVRVMNTKLREAVEDVQQIFPHLSLQYIHVSSIL